MNAICFGKMMRIIENINLIINVAGTSTTQAHSKEQYAIIKEGVWISVVREDMHHGVGHSKERYATINRHGDVWISVVREDTHHGVQPTVGSDMR